MDGELQTLLQSTEHFRPEHRRSVAEKVPVHSKCLGSTDDGQVCAGVALQVDVADRSKEIKYCQLVILESPQDGGVLILSCLSPVHSPGLDQEPDVLLLPHLHGNVGQAGAGVALVQLGQNCLHKICNEFY